MIGRTNANSNLVTEFTQADVSWTNEFNSRVSNWTLDVASLATNYKNLVLWESLFPYIKVNNLAQQSSMSYSYNATTGVLTISTNGNKSTANGWMQFGIYYNAKA